MFATACLVVAVVNIVFVGVNFYLYSETGLDFHLYLAIFCATTGLLLVRNIVAAAKQ